MYHDIRWTSKKIALRLRLAEGLVYKRRQPLASFRLLILSGPAADPAVEDGNWIEVNPNSYWVETQTNFLLRSHFLVP